MSDFQLPQYTPCIDAMHAGILRDRNVDHLFSYICLCGYPFRVVVPARYGGAFFLTITCGARMVRRVHYCTLVAVFVLCASAAWSQGDPGTFFTYMAPRPGATFVNSRTTLAFRSPLMIAKESISGVRVVLSGSKSGAHRSTLSLARDEKTLVCTPATPFTPGELVTVEFPGTVHARTGQHIAGLTYTFTVSPMRESVPYKGEPRKPRRGAPARSTRLPLLNAAPAGLSGTSTVPDDFPPIKILKNTVPGADPVFIGNFSWGEEVTPAYISILYRDGTPAFYRKVYGWDLKVQQTGLLTYYDEVQGYWYGMDNAYQVVDSFACGNGYNTNEHELQVMPDGHAWVMAYDAQIVGMDTVVEGGNPNAMVWGLIIQELDRDKNVTFEWRSWDAFKITDVTQEDLTAPEVDAVHGNSIFIDTDSSIIISSRSLDEVTKISRATGQIIWRMGGKNNEFTLHDPEGWFDHQHAAYRLPNGHLTLFDNGTFRGWSRAVEYAVDESLKVVTKVWEFNAGYSMLGWAMGNMQRLPNGNTMIGWGAANPVLSEVTSGGALVYQLDMRELEFTYRAYTFPWQTNAFVPAADTVSAPPTAPGDTAHFSLSIGNPTTHDILLTAFRTRSASFASETADSVLLPAGGSIPLLLRFQPAKIGPILDTLDIRSEDSTQGIIRRVILRGQAVVSTFIVAPATVQWGTVPLDSAMTRTLTLTPTTAAVVKVDSVRWSVRSIGLSRTAFSVHGPDTLQLTFVARPAGILHDTLTFYGDSARVLARVVMDATVMAPPPANTILVSPTALQFGTVPRDSTVTRILRLTTTSPGTVTVDTITSASAVFVVNKHRIPVTGADSITVSCTPHTVGVLRDTLALIDDSSRVLVRVPVEVTAIGPHLSFRPDSVNFSSVKMGDSVFIPLAVINATGSSAHIQNITLSGGPFSLFVSLPLTIGPYDSARVFVRFRPLALLTYRDTLTITGDAGSYRVPVVGKGGDPLVGVNATAIPTRYELGQNFPNPFNPSTTFTVGLPLISRVSVTIYDALGREVAVLVHGVLDPGVHRITWEAGGAASGLYICRCIAVPAEASGTPAFIETRKILLVR